MTTETIVNNFSLISRLFGNLFYRAPTDPILTSVFDWLQQQGLTSIWLLSTDSQSQLALAELQKKQDLSQLNQDYDYLFNQETGAVKTNITSYDIDLTQFLVFRHERNMPELDNADHFALLLLTASWIEDNLDSIVAQQILFEIFLLPCASKFLGQVEAHASNPFYRSLAQLCREILSAMADELEESNQNAS